MKRPRRNLRVEPNYRITKGHTKTNKGFEKCLSFERCNFFNNFPSAYGDRICVRKLT